MLSKFLRGSRHIVVRKEHIRRRHFAKVLPTSSYFLVDLDDLMADLKHVLGLTKKPVYILQENELKLVLWVNYGSVVGFYRKLQKTTNYYALIVKRRKDYVTVHTAYPDASHGPSS